MGEEMAAISHVNDGRSISVIWERSLDPYISHLLVQTTKI